MSALDELLIRVRADVNKTLDALIPQPDVEPRSLHEAVRWSLFGDAKRIRPAIVFAVGESFGADTAQLSIVSAAIEMIHTYSLIHDDLPAMDDDDLRRGRATCHKQFGEATAILAGDVLQTLAFQAVAGDTLLSPEVRLKLISILTNASGTPTGMVAGQQLDLDSEGQRRSIGQIEQIHSLKTGALISAAAISGAVIGNALENELIAVKQYAERLGLLFQITDDLLDVTQQTGILGKTAGKDASSEKATYPGHYGVESARDMAKDTARDAVRSLAELKRDISVLEHLATLVLDRTR